jgi:sugar phosphate isomerase/epimerase
MVRDLGLVLENVHAPFDGCNDLWSDAPSVREAIVESHLAWIEECAGYAIPMMVIHICRGLRREPPSRQGIEGVERIVRAAESAGVIVAVENTRSVDYLDTVLAEICSPHLRFCYDSSHDWIYSDERLRLLKMHADRLVAVHISDNDGKLDAHWLPGDGVIDWKAVAASLPKDIYAGNLTLEVVRPRKQMGKWPTQADFLRAAHERAVWLSGLIYEPKGDMLI